MRPVKPNIDVTAVQDILQQHWGRPAQVMSDVEKNGNFSTVYYFTMDGTEYVILFNQAEGEIMKESNLLLTYFPHKVCSILK